MKTFLDERIEAINETIQAKGAKIVSTPQGLGKVSLTVEMRGTSIPLVGFGGTKDKYILTEQEAGQALDCFLAGSNTA